ncbi:Peptidyl-prolyl cis-trans isomerase [Pseudomonas syringae pv. antirrhini]|jgi:FKBP-type peptidyl-prolyl cis-trans isomerase FklB|uniref:Peptidyl-prolyl cis-trans isomerase n=3 Tax=Pseudomonas syringae group TaxID=136849 RepID=A0A0Q0F2P7_PSESX|nr:Peptidyl-prolyl cis-trans isomerase [Pseudomonas syringae pv. apii]KPW51707.1 Peptidyl-prolyl cis-trans isomerase [Pseudomonas syringae pv. antirrhini]KPY57766.1 Peptidyl-prolyl cis-trans isomerase [Pseudomonas syringae pv. spinaceae]RMM06361.1 Peptidyl-prolyl cis-trans isomerase [Pseudomonas syringae]RMM76017.1 Peptidyl-prolyl cis-trans isomerase [Pseudomonas syringae pv. maculicola]RMQ29717.1 Peptidyl-prolyl cis-trans isomerase [Pseudomonas syringae pv. actinidiae]
MPVAIDRGGLISSRLYSFALLAHEQGISMKQHRLAAAIALVGLVLAGCDKQASTVELKTPAQKASYGIGLNMGKSLAQEGMDDLDSKAVALGIEDAVGKKDQKLKDEELVEAFSALQKRSEERLAKMSEEASAAGKKFLEENGKKDGVVTTASGLQYQIIKKADGAQPKPTDVVTVHYEGKLIDGKVFDSSVERGSPIDLPVGGVIPGWVEGLQLMHVGEKVKLFIPSDLAYGAQSPSPAIPANSVLVFDLELLGIKDPAAAPAVGADADEEEDAAPAASAPAKK